jgi:hypothetical protein
LFFTKKKNRRIVLLSRVGVYELVTILYRVRQARYLFHMAIAISCAAFDCGEELIFHIARKVLQFWNFYKMPLSTCRIGKCRVVYIVQECISFYSLQPIAGQLTVARLISPMF